MEFYAPNGKRPTRLSEKTRQLAHDSLNARYGLDTARTRAVSMDDFPDFASLSPLGQYDAIIARIAQTAPLRICEGEKISGAATLGLAIDHKVPATYGGEPVFSSISHLTVDFETVLKEGVNAIAKKAEAAYARYRGTEKEEFSLSCLRTVDSMRVWHARYLDALRSKPEYAENYRSLSRVPFLPAEHFHEAVQSLWFTFAFVRLCGNWPGIGRIDRLLGDYLEHDLAEGILTLDEAREILAHFFIKGCEWITGESGGSGDAQHYQNILLAGIDEDGRDLTNRVTYLVLDILEELGISDFPTTVRINRNTDEALLCRIAEVIRLGGGVIAVYNEDLIIESLVDYGYPRQEAAKFANDGCWEIQIPGKTFFTYHPFDLLRILQDNALSGYGEDVEYADFESLYASYITHVQKAVADFVKRRNKTLVAPRTSPDTPPRWLPATPCTVVSVFEEGCIDKGCSYLEGGPIYNVLSPHIGGLPDAANSLYAIKKLVYDEKKLTLSALMRELREDWQNNEPLRQYILNKYTYYGNDNDEVDLIARRITEDFADICDALSETSAYRHPAGISTFGRQLNWAPYRLATPYGRRAHEILAGNFSPTPGTDSTGATAIIRSYCKANLRRMVSGAALDIKLLPSAVSGENGTEVIASLIRGFAALGGHFMQLDITNAELLRRAQEKPEDYRNLSVRVSGWNARFVTLNREWQEMIIAQMEGDGQ